MEITLTQKEIDNLLNNMINIIFQKENIEELSKLKKRKKIYDYLVNNKEYDYELFEGIFNNYHETDRKKITSRNLPQEFIEPLITNKGICNGFAQVYKLLLEKIGIYSMCINCAIEYKNEYVGHQLNIVYNDETDTYSFDDITFGIQNNSTYDYFNYDNPEEKGQGIGPITKYNSKDIKWAVMSEGMINWYAKRDHSPVEPPTRLKPLFNSPQEMLIENRDDLIKYGVNIKKNDIINKRR